MRVLVLIPAFNEEECLESTVSSLLKACPGINYLIVNDGSSDGTQKVCESKGLTHVNLPINTGLTSAFRTGMKYAHRHDFDAVVQFDADGQHLPEYIPPMAKTLEETQADIVIASRFLDGTRYEGARGTGSRLISRLIKATTGAVITDPTSGMRMYDRKMIDYFAFGFDAAPEPDTIALAARKGCKIVEIQASMQDRQGGESYFKLSSVIKYMSRTCVSILLFQWLR